ncbi:hypothetical protein HKD37_01G001514 [Glycine soja]
MSTMATPPALSPPSSPSPSLSTLKQTRKATGLRSLATRSLGAERPVVHVDSATGKADDPHKKKLRTYLGIVAHDKVNVTYETWKEVPVVQKDLIWEDTDRDGVGDTVYENTALARRNGPSFVRPAETPRRKMCGKRHRPSRSKTPPPTCCLVGLMAEKTKKKLEEAAQSGSTEGVFDPSSPIRRHVKWKMARTKKTGQMTSEAAKEIAKKIDSFVLHGRQDVLTVAIGLPEHPGCVRAAGAGVTIKSLWHLSARCSPSFSHICKHRYLHCLRSLRLVPQLLVSTQRRVMGDSDKCGLYIKENPSRLVSLGRVYEGSTAVHNIPLLHGQVKVGVEEVKNAEAPIPIPTDETLNTFLAWPTHLVKRLSEHEVMSPAKPPDRPDHEIDDPLYLMTLTIPQLFVRPLQVMWDAIMFGVFNEHFPLYIKHKDLFEITHGDQCLSIYVIQLWILHLTQTSMRAGNFDVFGFLEPQSIQRSEQSQFESESYMKSWMQSSKRNVYLGAYLNGAHWQMVVILPKENLVVWFCSLHNRQDNYLKGIINKSVLFFNTFALA